MNSSSGSVMNLFLTLAVATSPAIVAVGYASGSAPEWVMLKATIGLFAIGLIGWIVSALARPSTDSDAKTTKGTNLDVILPETTPASSLTSDADVTNLATR